MSVSTKTRKARKVNRKRMNELEVRVNGEWPAIKRSLRAQLAKRRRYDDEARQEAAALLWEQLIRGYDLPLAIWRAAADAARGRRLVRRSDLETEPSLPPCDCGFCPSCARLHRVPAEKPELKCRKVIRLSLAADEGCRGWKEPETA